MDVYKVNPPGEGGVCAILSVICVYSRYPYLRPLVLVDAKAVAEPPAADAKAVAADADKKGEPLLEKTGKSLGGQYTKKNRK